LGHFGRIFHLQHSLIAFQNPFTPTPNKAVRQAAFKPDSKSLSAERRVNLRTWDRKNPTDIPEAGAFDHVCFYPDVAHCFFDRGLLWRCLRRYAV
jgi:hypothetical protein